jgi:hypothetical protein
MATQIKLRRDTAQNWTTSNPVLALGEPGIETDTYKFKFGDGQTAWSNLAYYGSDFATTTFVNNAISNVVGAAPALLNTLQELSNSINSDPSFFSTINNQLANKANVADIPSLNGYATESFVTNAIGQIPGSDWDNIANKPTFSTVATTGSYNDLSDLPSYSVVATTGSYNNLSDKPSIPSITGLATESFVSNAIANVVNSAPALLDTLNELANAIGNDSAFTTTITNQLANKANVSDIPSLSGYATETYVTSQGYITSSALTYGNISGTPTLSTVATSGDYNDLTNKPTIPSLTGYATETYVNNAVANVGGLGGGSGNSISEGSHTLQVNTDGSVTFPDGTIQTTAYITPQQYGFINQFIHSTNDNVDMEAVAMDSGGNSYMSYSYYDDNESRRFGGIIKLNSTGSVEWNKNLLSSNTNGEYPKIVSLEHVNVNGTNFLVTIGNYYDNNVDKDRGFTWFINPTDGTVGSMFDIETGSNSSVVLNDAVFGLDAGNQPFAVLVGHTYNEMLQKSFTPLTGSGLNKLVVSWSEYNASNVQPGESIYYTIGGNYQIRLNYFEVGAAPDGQSNGLWLSVSTNQNGTYTILRSNGWSGSIYGWGNPVNVRVLGSQLGGVDGVNDLTFDFNVDALNNNSDNVAGWASNIQGTAISDVVGLGWGDKDWSTEIGNTLSFNYQLNQQAYIARLGSNAWGKSVGDAESERLNTVVVDSNGNSYAGGYYWAGNKGSIVIKYDINGTQQWAVHVDSPNDTGNPITSIDLLSDGNLIAIDEEGIVTKINSSNGNIIWQVRVDPNDDISWDSNFKGTATPNGNYIFTNYEDDDYTLYVMCISGTDGSEVWSKRITRNFGGSDGEIYPQDDYEAQCIDCNDTSVTIAASTYLYFNNNDNYAGLVINFPINGENTNGVYGQYIIESVNPGYNTETTTATSATVNAISSPVTLDNAGPTVSTNTFTMTENVIGASAGPDLGNITFDGSKLSSPAPNSGDFPNGVITMAPGGASSNNFADYGQFINIYPTTAFDSPHIHIAAGNGVNGNGSLILGNDNYHIDVNNNGNIYIKTNNQNHTWTFDNNGNLTLPSGGGINDSSGTSVLGAGGIALTSLSVGEPGVPSSYGDFSYDNTTGVFTFTPPDLRFYFLEAYASVTYTLPGDFTEDVCRYSVVSANVNVPSAWFDTSTYTFTPQKAGYWEITACYDIYRNTEASIAIKKNNNLVAAAGSFNAVVQQITKIIYLNGSTDYINIVNVGNGALQRGQFDGRSWFQARWISE